MAAKVGDFSLILKLLGGIIIGALLGLYIGENAEGSLKHVMDVVVSLRHIFGQIIFFLVPLVIVGFITPAIVRLGQNASKILLVAVALAYVSSLGAALFSMISGYCIIPNLSIATSTETLRSLPEMVFRLDIPPLFSVMSALVLALTMGVAIVWTKSETLGKIFCEMERIMTALVNRIMIPILPFFVGLSFLGLAYEGSLSRHLPVFIMMVLIVIVGHFIWLAVLYGIGGALSGRNPSQVFRHYAPAYLTAVGTMSSAATLPVALECARKSSVLSRTMVEFMVPLGATVHLCGSVLTETFFVMTISLMLYGSLPSVGTMLLFCVLLGIFALAGIMFMTGKGSFIAELHHQPLGVIGLLGMLVLFAPGLMPCSWKSVQEKTIWGTFLLLGGAMTMTTAMTQSGLAQWLADHIHAWVVGMSWWQAILTMMVGTHIIRLGMLSNVAAVAMLAPVVFAMAPKLGLHPVAFTMLVCDTDTFAYILPTQITAAVIAHGTDTFSSTDYARAGWVSVCIAIAYGLLVMAPWYALWGMPVWDASAPWPF